jgi:hypothetical protein
MITKLIRVVLFAMVMGFSCTDDNQDSQRSTLSEDLRIEDANSEVDSTFQRCDSVFIATYPGTACCVSGQTRANPGDTVSYHYQINHKDPQMYWEIREGDITIIKGQDTHTVTVQFGPNFTTGIIGCVGSGIKNETRLKCSDRCIVRTPI